MAKLRPFTIDYRHEGRDYTMTLEATDHADAKRRMASAYFNGQPSLLVASVDVPKWLAKAVGA
jgi:uncharacterized protein YjaZ